MMSEPDGFPWPPQSFTDIFYAGDFVKNDGTVVKAEEFKTKVKAVYFSAHWVSSKHNAYVAEYTV